MEPSFPQGSFFLFQRCRATEQPLQPGDVVVLRRGGETWIKRVYATAGDRFWALREQDGGRRYTRPIRAGQQERFSRIAQFQRAQGHPCEVVELKVPAGKVFIMGDALASRDSRELGPVPESEVVGKVVTAMPGGLTEMPEWVELSFPSRTVFQRYNHPVPPNVLKREDQQRRAQGRQQSRARARSVRVPKVFTGNAV
jgi:signal peptidase I